MNLFRSLAGLVGLQASTPGPTDDYWYNPVGVMTAAGLKVDEDGARKISAWYRGRDILSTSVAMIPRHVYRFLPGDEGREVARNHPLEDIVHRKPNAGQDAFQYFRAGTADVVDHGWHYAFIREGARGFVDSLQPIDPTLVTPKQIESGPLVGRWTFTVRDPKSGTSKTYDQDDIFYLRGADGKGVLEYARDSLGLGLTLETYASNLFSNGGLSGGVIETPGPMPDVESMARLARQYVTTRGNWHMPKVIPHGATFKPAMMEAEKAQMILSRQFSVKDIARWLGLPAHMLGETDTAGVTGLEQRGQEFVTFSLGGWLSLWEFAINDQLILAPQIYYMEFTRDALVRGDLEARSTADVESVNAGIETADEVRVRRNLPKMGGKASELREPQNITGRGAKGGPQDNQRPGRSGDGKAEAIVVESAARILAKEVKTIQKLAVQHAKSQDDFAAAVTDFYAQHVSLLVKVLQMSDVDAGSYCCGQAAQVLDGNLEAMAKWETPDYARGLAAWALEDAA